MCNEILPSREKLQIHKKFHVDDLFPSYRFDQIQESFICGTCSIPFESEEKVKNHVKEHEQKLRCNSCDIGFKDPYRFATHIFKHTCDTVLYCPLCAFSTKNRMSLRTHINNIHLGKFTYKCDKCDRHFSESRMYKEHLNSHLGKEEPIVCVVCSKSFKYSRYMLNHQIRLHRANIEGQFQENECHICHTVVKNLQFLEKHIIRKHLGRTHQSNVSKNENRKILCDVCGQGFNCNNKLKIHYRIHTGEKPFKCSYCSKAFTKKDYLVMHERIHTGEKPYCCGVCGKCFNQVASLRLHMRGHTGDRPYLCPHCNAGCISNASLKLHIKSCIQSLCN